MKEIRSGNPIDLGPQEEAFFAAQPPPGVKPEEVKLELSANCHCGGRLVPHKHKPLVWICERSHWWNRRKHAYLQASMQTLPRAKGSA